MVWATRHMICGAEHGGDAVNQHIAFDDTRTDVHVYRKLQTYLQSKRVLALTLLHCIENAPGSSPSRFVGYSN